MTDERLTPRDGRSRAPARPRKINRLTPEERKARGNAARNECPRSGHGHWSPATSRPDPIALLEEQAATRVPELVPIRVRADAGLAVHLLPRGRADHGVRPRGHPALGAQRPALR